MTSVRSTLLRRKSPTSNGARASARSMLNETLMVGDLRSVVTACPKGCAFTVTHLAALCKPGIRPGLKRPICSLLYPGPACRQFGLEMPKRSSDRHHECDPNSLRPELSKLATKGSTGPRGIEGCRCEGPFRTERPASESRRSQTCRCPCPNRTAAKVTGQTSPGQPRRRPAPHGPGGVDRIGGDGKAHAIPQQWTPSDVVWRSAFLHMETANHR
jgi:hypothetical protein